MNKLAIFDCDGTLVDSGSTIHSALQQAFEAHGLECPPRDVTKKVIGLSLMEAMAALVPHGNHAALTQTYKDAFFAMRGAGQVDEPLFNGIVELLDVLEADNWLLGVATGKSDRGLRHCLEKHGLGDRFVTLQTADRNPSKPHPAMALAAMAEAGAEPRRTIFVGDTGWDMGCARGAGVGAIGAGWGYHEIEELTAGGAHVVALTPPDVSNLADMWLENGE
ncbi:HAD-IA family hydrolase [Sphingomonas sp. G124]|uniref:HAD-IA family hydrolase n=1 Tax=Sphingomonas cremea TaxID=2904799 RepID=A0A9X1QNK3_9SPHN|nr:HAD-IA family hydrolase [Sphingomonas cremea]MCF2515327.1 HAD-IA family hydrolase [Sphingomonas cremea]